MSFIIEKSEKASFEFSESCVTVIWFSYGIYENETQKIANLLNDTDSDSSNFATKNGMLLMIKITQNIVKKMKRIQALNLKKNYQIKSLWLLKCIHSCNRRYNSYRY